jgi:hypothetical protein
VFWRRIDDESSGVLLCVEVVRGCFLLELWVQRIVLSLLDRAAAIYCHGRRCRVILTTYRSELTSSRFESWRLGLAEVWFVWFAKMITTTRSTAIRYVLKLCRLLTFPGLREDLLLAIAISESRFRRPKSSRWIAWSACRIKVIIEGFALRSLLLIEFDFPGLHTRWGRRFTNQHFPISIHDLLLKSSWYQCSLLHRHWIRHTSIFLRWLTCDLVCDCTDCI